MENPQQHTIWIDKISRALQTPGIADRVKACIDRANVAFEKSMQDNHHFDRPSRIKCQYDALVAEGLIVG